MDESSSTSAIDDMRYTYIHDSSKGPPEAIDIHHVIVKNNASKRLILCIFSIFLLLLQITCFLFPLQVNSDLVLYGLMLCGCLIIIFLGKQVKKESVVILPGFGVQLETHYRSGRTVRRFFPTSNVLKPVLNECVTPVTCHWVLALIVRGERELILAFRELRPPVKMLVPVWKALCAANEAEDCTST